MIDVEGCSTGGRGTPEDGGGWKSAKRDCAAWNERSLLNMIFVRDFEKERAVSAFQGDGSNIEYIYYFQP